ncbi:hypothetical protein [Periweissella fabalis]|uniref:Uncharacterized protein n=1 Tax=Periweissella fabalis TaxID=1070421 RepID=A0A7X6N0J2_9LACO|nr:hypothetical protein [Periweissella fabalis]MCM0599269.1 hypothetical protein [Periweissella fabalis]NKZ23548.1 hypothetical protein [Periweissella fabalis]
MRKFVYTILMLLVLAMGVGAGTLIGYHYNDAADAVTAKHFNKAQADLNSLKSENQKASSSISSLKDALSFASSVSTANSTQPPLSNTELAMAAYLDMNGTTPVANLERFGAGAELTFDNLSDGQISISAGSTASTVLVDINSETVNINPDPQTATPGDIKSMTFSINDLNQRYAPYQAQLDAIIATASDDNQGN